MIIALSLSLSLSFSLSFSLCLSLLSVCVCKRVCVVDGDGVDNHAKQTHPHSVQKMTHSCHYAGSITFTERNSN